MLWFDFLAIAKVVILFVILFTQCTTNFTNCVTIHIPQYYLYQSFSTSTFKAEGKTVQTVFNNVVECKSRGLSVSGIMAILNMQCEAAIK